MQYFLPVHGPLSRVSFPPGGIWQYLATFLVAGIWGSERRRVLSACSGQRPRDASQHPTTKNDPPFKRQSCPYWETLFSLHLITGMWPTCTLHVACLAFFFANSCSCFQTPPHREEIFAKLRSILWQSLPSLFPRKKTLLGQTLVSFSEPTSQFSLDLGPILGKSAWSRLCKNPPKSVERVSLHSWYLITQVCLEQESCWVGLARIPPTFDISS